MGTNRFDVFSVLVAFAWLIKAWWCVKN